MASIVEICNLAISWLGGNLITSLDDDSDEAALCKSNYPLQRDVVLQEHEWSFAIKRVELPQNATEIAFGNEYPFALPGDYLRILSVSESESDNRIVDWRIEGGNILCATGSAFVRYIYRVTDPIEFTPLFIHALAARMAADMAIPLTRSKELRNMNWDLYQQKLAYAASADGVQGKSPRMGIFNLGRVRYGSEIGKLGMV